MLIDVVSFRSHGRGGIEIHGTGHPLHRPVHSRPAAKGVINECTGNYVDIFSAKPENGTWPLSFAKSGPPFYEPKWVSWSNHTIFPLQPCRLGSHLFFCRRTWRNALSSGTTQPHGVHTAGSETPRLRALRLDEKGTDRFSRRSARQHARRTPACSEMRWP